METVEVDEALMVPETPDFDVRFLTNYMRDAGPNVVYVVGIDPGFTNLGVALFRVTHTIPEDGSLKLDRNVEVDFVHSTTLSVYQQKAPITSVDRNMFASIVARKIRTLAEQYFGAKFHSLSPLYTCIERQYFSPKNSFLSMELLVLEQAIIGALGADKRYCLTTCDSKSVKKHFQIQGKKSAKKTSTIALATERCNGEYRFADDHQADAFFLAMYGVESNLNLTVSKLTWPKNTNATAAITTTYADLISEIRSDTPAAVSTPTTSTNANAK